MKCPNCGLNLDEYTLVPAYHRQPPAAPFVPASGPTDATWRGLEPLADSGHSPWSGDAVPMGMGGIPPFTEAKQRKPARPADVASDVVVPLLQSVITAGIAFLIGAGIAIAKEWDWWVPLVWGGAALGLVWIWRLVAHTRLLWVSQHIINRPPEYPAEAPLAQTFMLEVSTGHSIKRFDLPGKPRQFNSLAKSLLDGVPFTEDEFTPSGRLYSRPMFRQIVARFIELGYADWKNPLWHRGGLALTDTGIEFLETWVRDYRQGQMSPV